MEGENVAEHLALIELHLLEVLLQSDQFLRQPVLPSVVSDRVYFWINLEEQQVLVRSKLLSDAVREQMDPVQDSDQFLSVQVGLSFTCDALERRRHHRDDHVEQDEQGDKGP